MSDHVLTGLFDFTSETHYDEPEPIKRAKKERTPKPPKIAPVYTLDREAYLKRKQELETRDGTEVATVSRCPHCGRPM